jgi:hypothetical protein
VLRRERGLASAHDAASSLNVLKRERFAAVRVRSAVSSADGGSAADAIARYSVEMNTLFSSVFPASASMPSSLPTPDCL